MERASAQRHIGRKRKGVLACQILLVVNKLVVSSPLRMF